MLKVKKATHDWILVKPVAVETKSGIVLADINRKVKEGEAVPQKYAYAEVLEVGPGGFTDSGAHIPMCCAVGDKVLYASQLQSVLVGTAKTFWMRNLDVFAVLEEVADEAQVETRRSHLQ